MSEKAMINYLRELINLPSISSDNSKIPASLKTAKFVASKLEELGAETKIVDNLVSQKKP